jgi:hypothetical protein
VDVDDEPSGDEAVLEVSPVDPDVIGLAEGSTHNDALVMGGSS